MKRIIRQLRGKGAFTSLDKLSRHLTGFTIIELLTVMSIIVILIGLLVPALSNVRRYARKVRQMAQFHSIDAALELFNNEFDGYPPSGAMDSDEPPQDYCGALKLCEAMMGQDLMGFHPDSTYRSTGFDGLGNDLYPDVPSDDNLRARKGPYLPLESANAYQMGDIYDTFAPFDDPCNFVLCDVYTRVTHKTTGKKIGMPILYYKADTSKNKHDPDVPGDPDNIYDYTDNHELVGLGMPWDPPPTGPVHKLFSDTGEPEGKRFYYNIKNYKITTISRPFRVDSYILISAGFDGEYGTSDDVCNFEWKYMESLP